MPRRNQANRPSSEKQMTKGQSHFGSPIFLRRMGWSLLADTCWPRRCDHTPQQETLKNPFKKTGCLISWDYRKKSHFPTERQLNAPNWSHPRTGWGQSPSIQINTDHTSGVHHRDETMCVHEMVQFHYWRIWKCRQFMKRGACLGSWQAAAWHSWDLLGRLSKCQVLIQIQAMRSPHSFPFENPFVNWGNRKRGRHWRPSLTLKASTLKCHCLSSNIAWLKGISQSYVCTSEPQVKFMEKTACLTGFLGEWPKWKAHLAPKWYGHCLQVGKQTTSEGQQGRGPLADGDGIETRPSGAERP